VDRLTSFEQEWLNRFERFARTYDAEHLISGWSAQGLITRMAVFSSLWPALSLPDDARVLDVGCGAGTYVRWLTYRGCRPVGLDYSLPSVAKARKTDKELSALYVQGSAYSLPFSGSSFDLVVSLGVLQTLSVPELALEEMIRVLRPGSPLVLEFLNAKEIVELWRSVGDRVRGREPRLKTYSVSQIQRLLDRFELKEICRAGVYLMPRRFQQNSPNRHPLVSPTVARWLDRCPLISSFTAHAFLIAVRKPF